MVGYWEGALALQKAGRSLEEDAHLELVLEDKEISRNVGRMSYWQRDSSCMCGRIGCASLLCGDGNAPGKKDMRGHICC